MTNLIKGKIALIPGSFDPITNGHLDIVRRCLGQYEKIFLAVMINRDKSYFFTPEQRTGIVRAALSEYPDVEVIFSGGMLWELAKELHATSIVKGYRNEQDYAYEVKMAEYNHNYYPEAQTVLLPADPSLEYLSSTFVRERIRSGLSLDGYIPSQAIDEIYKIIPRTI